MTTERKMWSELSTRFPFANGISLLWPLLIPILILIPGINAFPFPPSGRFSDLVISHFPNLLFFRQSLNLTGAVPLWSNTILSGYPFAANPLSGIWYPPGWLALILPIPFGFNFLIAIHLIFGGLGLYLFLRDRGISHIAALFGGMAFVAMPKFIAHYGAGHLTLIYAVTWTPWLLYCAVNSEKKKTPAKDGRMDVLPAVILGIIFLADPRWVVYAGLLWWAQDIAYSQFSGGFVPRLKGLLKSFKRLLPQTLLAGMIAAPLGLPLLEYTQLSTRAELGSGDILDYSLPPARLLGLIFPNFGGFHEWVLYPGAFIFILAAVGILSSSNKKLSKFWFAVGAIATIYSMGKFIPVMRVLTIIPGFDLLRVPTRALFITGLAFLILAAVALEDLLNNSDDFNVRRARLATLGLGAFPVIIFLGSWFGIGYFSIDFAWGAGSYLIGAAYIWMLLGRYEKMSEGQSRSRGLWIFLLFGLCLLDWGVVNKSLFTFRSKDVVMQEQYAVGKYLADQPGLWRVYSPSYSIPQQSGVLLGLELADGVDPLHLKSYTEYMEQATGIPVRGYSVTIPPFANGDPQKANRQYHPNPELLGGLNVKYIVSEYDLNTVGLDLRAQIGESRIYQNSSELPRAWVQPESGPQGLNGSSAMVQELLPNHISVSASGPGLLVLSEIYYPGWRVWVDGTESKIEVVNGLLRGVTIPAGNHQIIFRYRPLSVYAGVVLSLLGLLIAGVWRLLRVGDRRVR